MITYPVPVNHSMSGKLLRINQLDAQVLDNAILEILQQKVEQIFDSFQPGLYVLYSTEIKLILQLICLKHILTKQANGTLGQQMLHIEYECLSNFQRYLYAFIKCLPYIREKIAFTFPGRFLDRKCSEIAAIVSSLQLLNLFWFLKSGSKPGLVDRFLRLNQVCSQKQGRFSKPDSQFFIRELVWNCLNDFLVSCLPLIRMCSIKRQLHNILTPKKDVLQDQPTTQKQLHSNTKCGYCNQQPILPHHMGCVHFFCYYCLKGNQQLDPNFQCPKCNVIGKVCLAV